MEKIINFLKSKKELHQILKVCVLFLISIALFFVPNAFVILSSVVLMIISLILMFFVLIKLIDNKKIMTRKIFYISGSILSLILLIFSLSKDVPYLKNELLNNSQFNQYVITNVAEINENNVLLKGKVNEVETEFEMLIDNKSNYEIGDEIKVFINSNEPTNYTFIEPTLLNMFFLGIFSSVNGTILLLLMFFIRKTKYVFKLKQEYKVKVKTWN